MTNIKIYVANKQEADRLIKEFQRVGRSQARAGTGRSEKYKYCDYGNGYTFCMPTFGEYMIYDVNRIMEKLADIPTDKNYGKVKEDPKKIDLSDFHTWCVKNGHGGYYKSEVETFSQYLKHKGFTIIPNVHGNS